MSDSAFRRLSRALHLGRFFYHPMKAFFHPFGYSLVPTASLGTEFPVDFDSELIETVRAVRPFTMTRAERIYALVRAVEYVERARIPGAFVECGVWRGGSMMVMASSLIRLGAASRDLHLFDTFKGMPPPTEHDSDFREISAADLLAASDPATSHLWGVAGLEDVKRNLESTGYPRERIHYSVGKVEDTIPDAAPPQISLLRLDTDWFESTRHEMEHLFPRLSDGGILIIDDYGHWRGARKAVDEYLSYHGIHLYLSRVDYTARIAVKHVGAR